MGPSRFYLCKKTEEAKELCKTVPAPINDEHRRPCSSPSGKPLLR
ncbi:hypothetical protein ABZ864_25400 [Streptomyces sp. NPDC047082]